MTTLSKHLVVLVPMLVASIGSSFMGLAAAQTPAAPTVAAPPSAVRADSATMESLQQRLRQLSAAGVGTGSYSLGKAQCWLNTARTQYAENDRSSYVEESLQESARIIQALEADKTSTPGFETPLVARSKRLRDDLWARFAQYKSQPGPLACTGAIVACGEINLVRAGHAEQQIGWRTATPYLEMAEDAVQLAQAEAARCMPVVASPPPPPPPPPPQVAAPVRERFTIESDALFKFAEAGVNDMLPAGQERIRALAQSLLAYQSIDRVRIVGHTDRIGSDAFNDRLSLARAVTVKDKLEGLGVKAAVFEVQGVGKREPVTTDCSAKQARAALIACLQPDRRVTIEVTGIK